MNASSKVLSFISFGICYLVRNIFRSCSEYSILAKLSSNLISNWRKNSLLINVKSVMIIKIEY